MYLGMEEDGRDPGKNKKRWTTMEDAKLVEAMLDVVNEGLYKADNGFKPGFLQAVEEALSKLLPNTGIKPKPHIESRMKTMKKDWIIIYDMMNNHTNWFGNFTLDYDKVCVTAASDVWESYLQVLTIL